MYISLSDISAEPLQLQILHQIRAAVLSGELEPGYMLPSIRTLAKEQRVSVITVQKAYENLEREGLIHARRGKGYFVSDIHIEDRKKMIKDDLIEKINPVVKKALLEGMEKQELKKIINLIINEQAGL